MKFIAPLLIVLVQLTWITQAYAQAGYARLEKGPRPDWVDVVEILDYREDRVSETINGLYFLITDEQVRWDGKKKIRSNRLTTKVLSRAGLEEVATISRSFDPSHQVLILTNLDIIRDGKVISLEDSIQHQVFRRETQLDRGIIDGSLTVHIDVPNVRVGDIIDVSFVQESLPLIEGAKKESRFFFGWSVPVEYARFVLYWPESTPFRVAKLPDDLEVNVDRLTNEHRYSYVLRNSKTVKTPDNLPKGYDAQDYVGFVEYSDWTEVSEILTDYYQKDYELPRRTLVQI